jgi:hypothetical protein
MSKPFDATTKDLGRDDPRSILAAFDAPPTVPVSLLNVDLSTVTKAADLVFGLGDPLIEIVHIDFQASAAAQKDADVRVCNALLHRLYRVPVHSILVLLRSQAEHASVDGTLSYAPRPGRDKMEFEFEIVRLWERSVEELLAGGLGAAPLAMLGRLPEGVELVEGLTGVAQRLMERLNRETTPDRARKLMTAAWVLTGLRLRRDVALQVFRGVPAMEESDTYMAIIDTGREREARRIILRQGEKRFGPPSEEVRTRVQAIADIERLEQLLDAILTATSWSDLLGGA